MSEKKDSNIRTGTRTSSFGSSKRTNHDSSIFYSRRIYSKYQEKKIEYRESIIPLRNIDKIFCKTSENMDEIPEESIHLMVTSPPYGVGKLYDEDLTLRDYLKLLKQVFEETWRVLVPGGRAAINIANIGRKPYIPLHAYVIEIMHKIGFHMRGEIIWNKAASSGVSTAWGSFASASNPCLRDVHEYILIFSKITNKLEKGEKKNTIEKVNFVEWSKSIWNFSAVSAKKVGHPAPFPIELPRRLIEFYSYENDVILDPFIGSGTTALAAIELNRHYVGYDISQEYVDLARKKIKEVKNQLKLDKFLNG